jgi:exoribonuclease-2
MKVGNVLFVYRSEGWEMTRFISAIGERREVEHLDGTRQTYHEKRVARVSEKSVPSVAALEAYRDQVDELISSLPLDSLWGHALDSGGTEQIFTPEDIAALVLPNAQSASDDAAAQALFEDKTYFKRHKQGGYRALSPDTVRLNLRERERLEREQRRYETMVSWLRSPYEPMPDEAVDALSLLEHLVLYEDASDYGKRARQLLRDVYPKSSETDVALAFKALVTHGIFRDDENLVLRRAGLPDEFPLEVVEQADEFSKLTVSSEQREDHRELLTVAIDDQYTTEIDDALAIETRADGTWLVHVYIADAAAFIPPGSVVDQDASVRASTLYVPEGKVPMLPECLCENAASLKTGVDRPALDFALTVDEDGNILSFDIAKVFIHVDAHLSYDHCDRLLAKTDEHPAANDVRLLLTLADAIRERRRRGGSITLDRSDTTVVLDEKRDDPARRMIAEWMIAACSGAARWCYDHDMPTLYRTQRAPDEAPRIPQDRPMRGFELQRVLRTLRKAELSTEPRPHAGLGVEFYTQISSPLRRYADLLMHRQIHAVLRTGRPYYSINDLRQRFDSIEHVTGLQRTVERQSRRFWILRRLEHEVGTNVRVEVIRQLGRRFVVELVDWGVQCAWTPRRTPALGDCLDVTLSQVNARRDRLIITG